MLRLVVGIVVSLVLLAVPAAGSAAADRSRLLLAEVKASDEAPDLVSVTPGEAGRRTLLPGRPGLRRGLGWGESPSWSPDGRLIAFQSNRYIWVVGPDGRGPRRVPGTRGGYLPVFSPDGRTLAFARSKSVKEEGKRFPSYESAAVWLVDIESGDQHRLTRLRNGLEQYPTSFSPDGSTLLVTRIGFGRSIDFELVAIRFDGRTSSLLVGRGAWGKYSPNGSRIVFVEGPFFGKEGYDIFTVDARGDHRRQLTDTPGVNEVDPSWDPSGRRIVYSRMIVGPRYSVKSAAIWQLNADGTCAAELFSRPGYWYFAPVFQPGPGRGLGPLSC